jgi:hypothetical protein
MVIFSGKQESPMSKLNAALGRPRSGSLYWTKSGWRARLTIDLDGVRTKRIVNLDTANRAVAEHRAKLLVADAQSAADGSREKRIRNAWAGSADVWALDFEPIEPPRSAGVYAAFVVPGFVKIGRAENIAERICTMQTFYPIEVSLLAVLSADPDDEFQLHARFAADRVRGEWFVLSRRIRAALAEARKDPALARDVPCFLEVIHG